MPLGAEIQSSLCAPCPGSDHFTLYAGADISEMMNWILRHKSKARDDISYFSLKRLLHPAYGIQRGTDNC